MLTRIAIGVVAALLLALGAMNAANKAGLLGPTRAPTRIAAPGFALALAPVWHADTGDLADLKDGVCRLVAPATACAGYFIKGLGSPKALAVIASGPMPAGGIRAAVKAGLSEGGVEVPEPQPVPGLAGAQRFRTAYKKRGRQASVALTDAIPAGDTLVLIQIVAEEPEGRYQGTLLAEIEKTLEVPPK